MWQDLQVISQLQCTALYCTVLHCAVLYCTVLHCTVLYLSAVSLRVQACLYVLLLCTALYCIVLLLPAPLRGSTALGDHVAVRTWLQSLGQEVEERLEQERTLNGRLAQQLSGAV